ncbi:endothelin-converting enzyme 1-like isoform X2 [Leptopilina heterotoma]|uniref:endothelin-converting enzyme 1-like isoform X2 n=1 Tax=Leptopilina heterotoma TaxID=63436 RepID=UPI001CA861B8|nr:endothelin-converting enzyme 1-like isoform X2 [Leptopilina heterotoma]
MQFWFLPVLSVITVVYCEEMDLDQLSALLYSGINQSADPCDNFYDFVCGKWVKNNPSVEYIKKSWDLSELTKFKFINIVKDILEGNANMKDNAKLSMEKMYYKSCIDEDYSVRNGKAIFADVMSKTNWEGQSWQDVAKYFATIVGETFLFQIVLDEDTSLNIVKPYKSRTNSIPFRDEPVSYKHNIHVFLSQHKKITKKTLDKHKTSLLKFMQRINKLVHDEDLEIGTYTIGELQKFYDSKCSSLNDNSKINWLDFLRLLADDKENSIDPSFKVVINTNYILQLCRILSKTPISTIVLYMQFNFEFTPEIYYSLNTVEGVNSSPERSYYCLNNIPMTLGFSDVIMNNKEFDGRERFVMKLLDHFKPILRGEIDNSWIDHVARNDALNIISEIKLLFLPLNYVFSEFMLEKTTFSYNFAISRSAFQNLINFKKAQTVHYFQLAQNKQQSKSKNNRRSKREMKMHLSYEEGENSLMISPIHLFAPYYHHQAPTAYNIGKMGDLIGHEMSHAFDIDFISKKYKKSWNEENPDMATIFNERKTCLINHYNNLNVNGAATLNENYADLQGLKLSFKAMRQIIDAHPSLGEKTLPGFEQFNTNQLFFISFANNFCEKSVTNNDEDHAPSMARAVGTLKNMKEFADAFNCRKGQHMNPIHKCDFWENENP